LDTQSVDGATSCQQHQEISGVLPLLERIEANKFRNILTGEESWFMLEYQHAVKWSFSREDVLERVRQQVGTKKLCSLLFKEETAFMLLV
jgi:hypothetical protein